MKKRNRDLVRFPDAAPGLRVLRARAVSLEFERQWQPEKDDALPMMGNFCC